MRASSLLVTFGLAVVTHSISTPSPAQTPSDFDRAIEFLNQGLQERSYIVAGTGYEHENGLWFEASLKPSFNLLAFGRPDTVVTRNGVTNPWLATVSVHPRVTFRMERAESDPVRPPNYNPAAVFRLLRADQTGSLAIIGEVAHWSNGQQGCFYTDAADNCAPIRGMSGFNYTDGSFSTNYVRYGGGGFVAQDKLDFEIKIGAHVSYEFHPKNWVAQEVRDQRFSRARLNWGVIYLLESDTIDWLFAELRFTHTWAHMRDQSTSRTIAREHANHWFLVEAQVGIPEWSDFSLLFRLYRGEDYMNSRFTKKITAIGIGIQSNPRATLVKPLSAMFNG